MKTRIILETLKKQARLTNMILNILIGGYSYQRMKRRAFYPTLPDFSEMERGKQSLENQRHNLYSLLYKLQKQGLIEKDKKDNKTFWRITIAGKKKLEALKNVFYLPKRNYKKEKDEGFNVVIFDIPEKERFKRKWLRSQLISLGFSMLQKSVWIGKNKLPKEFLNDLNYLGLIDFIQIFKISKTGTIKEK
jgi:DNA-binding PadR family transcriptional regulator